MSRKIYARGEQKNCRAHLLELVPKREYLILAVDRLTFGLWNAIPHVDSNFEFVCMLLTQKRYGSEFSTLDDCCQAEKSILMFSVIAKSLLFFDDFNVAREILNLSSDLPS